MSYFIQFEFELFLSIFALLYIIFHICIAALHRCSRSENVQGCRLLLSYGAGIDVVSHQGYTPPQLASSNLAKIIQGEFGLVGLN